MTKTSHLLPLSLALSAALLLGACSKDAPAQAPAGRADRIGAAGGWIDHRRAGEGGRHGEEGAVAAVAGRCAAAAGGGDGHRRSRAGQ
ncbi:hypothetical protein G6F61_014049 [Rhizopus arrhizus]|nr:hypothetical protein G6F61_014049 [Rhizopus arrhizus]